MDEDRRPGRADNLILDELTDQLDRTFRLLRGDADEAADLAFAEVRVDTVAEARLLRELAERAPLAHPERFTDAHRLVMHALEVLDRDGWRRPRLPRLGPLRTPVEFAVEFVAKYVVRSYVADSIRNLARLYARRESQAEPESNERRVLARARIQADRLTLGFRGGASGLPTVLIGGAAIPVLASLSRQFGITTNDVAAFMKDIQIDATSFPGKAFELIFEMPEEDVGIMTFNKCCAPDQWEALGRPDILEKNCHSTCPASLIETAKMYNPNMKVDILAIPPAGRRRATCAASGSSACGPRTTRSTSRSSSAQAFLRAERRGRDPRQWRHLDHEPDRGSYGSAFDGAQAYFDRSTRRAACTAASLCW